MIVIKQSCDGSVLAKTFNLSLPTYQSGKVLHYIADLGCCALMALDQFYKIFGAVVYFIRNVLLIVTPNIKSILGWPQTAIDR